MKLHMNQSNNYIDIQHTVAFLMGYRVMLKSLQALLQEEEEEMQRVIKFTIV